MSVETVHVFVCDSMLEWEPGYAMTGLNDPTWQKRQGRFQVRTVGLTGEPVTSTSGLRIVPDTTLDELEPARSAMLILPGSNLWGGEGEAAPIAKVAAFLEAGVPVAAICGATLGLAGAGLLDARPHTSNAAGYLKLAPGYHGEAFYREQRAVTDGDLITAGSHSPMAFACEIFRRLDVFTPAVLEAWREVYTEGGMPAFERLVAASQAPA